MVTIFFLIVCTVTTRLYEPIVGGSEPIVGRDEPIYGLEIGMVIFR